jgi:Tfp pilus assembly protein PilV
MRNTESGFSLVSVLIAMILLSVGILAISHTNFVVLRAHGEAATRTAALSVARAYLEELRSRNAAALATEAPVSVDERGQVNSIGPYRRSLLVEVVGKNLKRVTVTVTAPRPAGSVHLVTNAFVSN